MKQAAEHVKGQNNGVITKLLSYVSPLTREPMKIRVAGDTKSFRNVEEFAAWLDAGAVVSTASFRWLQSLSDARLNMEMANIKANQRQLADLLVQYIGKPSDTENLDADISAISTVQDHDWMDVIAELSSNVAGCYPYKKLAVAKYLRYLIDREDVINAIYGERNIGRRQIGDLRNDQSSKRELCNRVPSETDATIIDLNRDASELIHERLPAGESIRIEGSTEDQPISIRLGRHDFLLTIGARAKLVDENGRTYELDPGCHIVGRDPNNDVVVNPFFKSVSRKHMMLEFYHPRDIQITDCSSQGTYLACPFVPIGRQREKID